MVSSLPQEIGLDILSPARDRLTHAPARSGAASIADACGKRIGVLIVAYNAVTTLSKVLNRISPEVWDNIEEVAVFDDASDDSTFELAVGLQALSKNKKLQVLKNARNLGYGGNQKAGYSYFLEKGFDIVVLLHGDGQYAPELLAHLYSPLVRGEADAVFGSRMMRQYGGALKGGMPLYKYIGNRLLTEFENRSLGMKLTEFHSGYRAYNLHALKQIDFSHMTDHFHFDTEIIIKLNHQRCRIREVPIPTYYGTEICRVEGLKYARNVTASVVRYHQTCRSIKRHPEFQEYFVHYPVKASSHSSHAYLRQAIGTGKDVLDVGCGEGFLARELQSSGNRIWGVDALASPECRSAFEHYVQADLDANGGGLRRAFGGRQFDCILLMDVLEHLRSAEAVLEECLALLKPNGTLIVSLPNVANITVRGALLLGKWEYAERGILDRTHVRFFTRRTARELLQSAGLEIVRQQMTAMPTEVLAGPIEGRPLLQMLHKVIVGMTKLMPGLFGYQTFLSAQISRSGKRVHPHG